jgi:2-hydroxymuconate-semialdehyde hydrolase
VPFVSRWIDVKGTRIHFLESGGAGEDSPVLLMVHGWAGSAVDWGRLLPFLPPHLRAIALDLPGCGLSDKPDEVFDMQFFLDALHSFCGALGISSMVLAGHSMGGQIAVHFTSRFPGMVEKLILVDPYGLQGEEGGRRTLARLGPVVNLAFLLNTRLFITWAMRANVLHNPPPDLLRIAVEATAASILGRESVRAISRITKRIIGRENVEPLLPGISQETLLIWGDEDRLLPPRWADAFAARLRRVSLHRVPGAGHMPMFEAPAVVAGLVTDFLQR